MECMKCGFIGDEEDFARKNKSGKGLCRKCKAGEDKEYREKNKEKMKAYFKQKWRTDEERRKKNKKMKEIQRTGLDASEYVKDKNCEICGMSNEDHFCRYGERLHVHHKENTGRKNIRLGEIPDHSELQVLCRSCHVKEDNKNRSYKGRGYKSWETRRRNAENNDKL